VWEEFGDGDYVCFGQGYGASFLGEESKVGSVDDVGGGCGLNILDIVGAYIEQLCNIR